MVWHRLVFSTGNMLSSIVLGIIAMFLTALYAEGFFQSILRIAGQVEYALTHTGLIPTKYNNLVELMLGKHQIVLVMFVLVVRMISSLLYALFIKYVLGWRD